MDKPPFQAAALFWSVQKAALRTNAGRFGSTRKIDKIG
jgi:hypothetical protein